MNYFAENARFVSPSKCCQPSPLHSWAPLDDLIDATWLIRMWHDLLICDMTHPYGTWLIDTWHDSLIRDLFLVDTGHDSFTCDMTHSYVTWLIHMWHDSFICDITHSYVTWLIHMWHDSLIQDMIHWYGTWRIHIHRRRATNTCSSPPQIVWCATWLIHIHRRRATTACSTPRRIDFQIIAAPRTPVSVCFQGPWLPARRSTGVTRLIDMSFDFQLVAVPRTLFHVCFWGPWLLTRRTMGWLRWVGSLKLLVSFAEYGLFYRALLQKRPCVFLRLLTPHEADYGVATMSRLLKIIGLFCKEPYKRDHILQKRPVILRSLLTKAIPCDMTHWFVVWFSKYLQSREQWSMWVSKAHDSLRGGLEVDRMLHIWMSYDVYMNESCRTYEWVMSHMWMSRVVYMDEPCRTYEWVMSHIRMSPFAHMDESYRRYLWYVYVWHIDVYVCHMCDMTIISQIQMICLNIDLGGRMSEHTSADMTHQCKSIGQVIYQWVMSSDV